MSSTSTVKLAFTITRRKYREELHALKPPRLSNPDVLRSILDHLPNSIFVKDEDLRFVYSNAMHDLIIGKPEAEVLGKTDHDFYPEADADGFARNDHDVLDSGETSVVEEMARNLDGMSMPVLTQKVRLDAPDGKTYLIGINSDMTATKSRENQYRALAETVPVAVAQIDENFNITFANPLFNAYCGGDGTEHDQGRLISKLRESSSLFPGEACKFEGMVQGLGNQPRSVFVISSGWLELGSAVRSATVSLVDISQMTELQQINDEVSRLNRELAANMTRLNAAQDDLLRASRLEQLGQLTATVAHELRNPLGTVRTSAFLLERKVKDKGLGVEAQLDRINKGIERCDNIITQLLDFSRTRQLNCHSDDMDKWLAQIVEEEAGKLPQTFTVELKLGLRGQHVPFDPARLQRAVINMINNSAEAISGLQDQHPNPMISVSSFLKSGHVSLRVSDNGPGIAPDVLARIREPLFTTKSFGTGLGIPAIEQIAVQHGGRLDVATEIGKGSKFTIWLPLKRGGDAKVA
jgi:PAS domain S-box-containing protein